MAPVTFHLISVSDETVFLNAIRSAPAPHRPYYVGHCEHWVHSPKTSLDALTGSGSQMKRWDYLVIASATPNDPLAMPTYLENGVADRWSITAPVDDAQLSSLSENDTRRSSVVPPVLPPGWSPSDHTSLLASNPPSDVEFSLALSATPLGAPKANPPIPIKTFIQTFGANHSGPVNMFNLMAYNPGQRARFFNYIAAFSASIGSRYGGEAQFHGMGVTDWSSRASEGAKVADPQAGGSGVWEDVALVWYPSLWHFAKLLDDPDYADADRKFKVGAVRDNPILCCRAVEL